MLGSGCARLWLRMWRGPLPAEVGKEGVLRETKRTVEAGAMIFWRVGSGPEDVGFGVGAAWWVVMRLAVWMERGRERKGERGRERVRG
jgi:hypothetical protein